MLQPSWLQAALVALLPGVSSSLLPLAGPLREATAHIRSAPIQLSETGRVATVAATAEGAALRRLLQQGASEPTALPSWDTAFSSAWLETVRALSRMPPPPPSSPSTSDPSSPAADLQAALSARVAEVRSQRRRRRALVDCIGLEVEAALMRDHLHLLTHLSLIAPGADLPSSAAALAEVEKRFPGQSARQVCVKKRRSGDVRVVEAQPLDFCLGPFIPSGHCSSLALLPSLICRLFLGLTPLGPICHTPLDPFVTPPLGPICHTQIVAHLSHIPISHASPSSDVCAPCAGARSRD